MKSIVLNNIFNLNEFKEVADANIERYNFELSQDQNGNQIHIKELMQIIKNSGKMDLFIETMDNIKEEFLFKSDIHGISHNERVAIFIFAIGILEGLNDNDLRILLEAAKYHDIGRTNNGVDRTHGKRSADKIDELGLDLTEEENSILKIICKCHSIDDSKIDDIIEKSEVQDKQRCKILAQILKDADALDRVRLRRDGLDSNYLRTDSAKQMILSAYELYYNYNLEKEKINSKELENVEINPEMNVDLFDISKFNIIEDEENYYYFRSITSEDLADIENIGGLRTNRQRTEDRGKVSQYANKTQLSLQEVWDHIRYGHTRDANCISLSGDSNVILDYGRKSGNNYVLIKVPKVREDNSIYNAGQYMLEEINKKINEIIKELPPDSEILKIFKKIDSEPSYKEIGSIASEAYVGVKKTNERYTRKGEDIRSKQSIRSRFERKQYFSEEQQLEYNRIIAKLSVLEAYGLLRSILPTKADNSSLIATIGMAFSSEELVHYGEISEKDHEIIPISAETVEMFSIIQQLKEKEEIDINVVKELEKTFLQYINKGYKIKKEEGVLLLTNSSDSIKIKDLNQNIQEDSEDELTVEKIYEITKGRISYKKAKIAIQFIRDLSKSRLNAIDYADIIRVITNGNQELAKIVEENCYILGRNTINRENNLGIKISGSVNIGLSRTQSQFISQEELLLIINFINGLDKDNLEKLLSNQEIEVGNLLNERDKVSENEYFAEAIIDNIDFEKIYKKAIDERRTITEEERKKILSELNKTDCKRLYNAFKKIGANESEISGFILNLLLNNGYKGYSLSELSMLEDLDEIIRINCKNNNLKHRVSGLKLDKFLGILDDAYEVDGSTIKLRDYQYDTLQNVETIHEDKRFAAMILPTGAGKSFVTMSAMLKYKKENKNIIYIAPRRAILHQFEVHILRNILKLKIITNEEISKLKEEGRTIPKDVIVPKDFKKTIETFFPNLKMFCYDLLEEKDDEWLKERDADFIVLDELHRAGAPTWKPKIKRLIELNPKAKILGMTATPVRDVDNEDMARQLAIMSGDYSLEELNSKEYIASEMHLLDAMQDGYVVKPKLVAFDYMLKESDEYKELIRMIEVETDPIKKQELLKRKAEMDKLIPKSELEGISDVFTQNIKKKNGKYIIFLPRNIYGQGVETSEYIEQEIERIKKYFFGVNSKIKTSYLLSGRNDGKSNDEILAEFETTQGEELQLLFSIDMLNEGVHVDGIDGVVMMRPISENSKILYLQQIGRCIFSEDPEHPIADEDRPIIFDVYNNYMAHNLDREANKANSTSDLQRLIRIINWINKHGYIPDINSDEINEAKKAIVLKNIQRKYKKYINGIDKDKFSEDEKKEILQILELGKTIDLWDIEFEERIIPPGERDISRNDVFKVTGTQKEFLEVFKKAKELSKDKEMTDSFVIKKIVIPLLDILSDNGIEINNENIFLENTLKDILSMVPEDIREKIKLDIEEYNIPVDEDYKIGEGYNLAKEMFYNGKSIFSEYEIKELRKLGIFEEFILSKTKTKEISVENNFIIMGPRELKGINIKTGTYYDENGYNMYGLNELGFSREDKLWYGVDKNGKPLNSFGKERDDFGYNFYGINEFNFGRNGHYYKQQEDGSYYDTGSIINENGLDVNGDYWEENEKGELVNTGSKFGKDGYSLYGINEKGYSKKTKLWHGVDIKTGKPLLQLGVEREEIAYALYGINKFNFGRNRHYYKKDENGNYYDTGSLINENGLDANGDYWEENEKGELVNTGSKFGKDGYSLYGINKYGFSKEDKLFYGVNKIGAPTNHRHPGRERDELGYNFYEVNEFNFGRNGHYYKQQEDGSYYDTGSLINENGLDANGDYWEVNEKGELVNTHSKFGKDGYSLYGINKYGFSKKDKLFYGVNEKGKPINSRYLGKERDKLGFNFYEVNKFNFGRNGNYYIKKEDGSYYDTGSLINENGLDANGDYWEENEKGELVNTHSKFGKDGYSLYGINKYGFKSDGLWYGIDKNGAPTISPGRYTDEQGYNFYGVNEFNFGRNGNYYKQQEDGSYYDTGSKLNENGLDANGDYWEANEKGELVNTGSKFGKDGYSLYGINERGFSKRDKLFYGVEKGMPKIEYGRKYDYEGFNFWGINEAKRAKDGKYYEVLEDGTLVDISSEKYSEEELIQLEENAKKQFVENKINENGLDVNGDYWEENESGELINTHLKFGKDGYNLYGLNQYGFKANGLWYGIDITTGKPIYKYGQEFDDKGFDIERYNQEGYNEEGLDRYNFDEDGYWYKQDETGTYINTGLKYNKSGFIKGDYAHIHIITKSRVDLRRFDIDGIHMETGTMYDKNGFKQDGTYKETGEKYHEGYNAYGVDENGRNKEGQLHYDIIFAQKYISSVIDNTQKVMQISEKQQIQLYRAQEMYPKLKEEICKVVLQLKSSIEKLGEEFKNKRIKASEYMLKRKEVTKIISILDPTEGLDK